MGNQYDEDEDMDEVEAEGTDDGADREEPEEEAEVEARGSNSGPAPKSGEDVPEERTVSSRQGLRDEMSRQIEDFLARGGQIKEIDPNVTADPPRKPESEYGSRPI
ncbi:MAG: hypothetical protein ABW049_13900 [Spongiibacteraceae bacterium]